MSGAPFANGETVTILTAGTATDPYSKLPAESWSATPTEVNVDGCGIEPRVVGAGGSAEPVFDARNAVTSGFTIYMPPDAADLVTAKNKVRVRGIVYDVLGEPAVWRSPFTGWAPGIVIQAVRTEG